MKFLSGKNLIIMIILIISGCFAIAVNAAFNEQINFQGKLTDNSDVNVADGDYNFEFKLWSHESTTTGSYLKWTETCTTTKISVTGGLFSHLLGSVNTLPDDIFNQTLWLEVAVGSTTTEPSWEILSPRKKLGAVPAAFEAKRLEGYTTSSFAILSEDETITGAWTFNNIISATASSSSAILTLNQTGSGNLVDFQVGTSSKFVINNSGNIATGTWQATPVAVGYGGTGGTSTSTARTNLGLAIGTDVQAYHANLAAISASTWTGASSITTLGTIGTGTWNGSVILPTYGGTGTGTNFTAGSVVFAGASGVYSQNNSSFFWDNANYRLGIGTTTPGQRLTVAASLSSTLNSGYFSTGNVLFSSLKGGMYFGRVGVRENIFGLTNYANTWTAKSPSTSTWNSVAMSSDGRTQTAVSQVGTIYSSTDYGNTWALVYTTAAEPLSGVAMSSDGKIQTAVATDGRIYVSSTSTTAWSAEDSNRYWAAVAMSSDGKIQTALDTGGIAGYGYIYLSTDYGDNWATTSATSSAWTSLAMSSDGKLQTATINNDQVYVSTDYGASWTAKASTQNWNSVAMSSDGKLQTAVAYEGQIYLSTDYGSTWTATSSSLKWKSIAMSSDGKIQTAVVDESGQIYVSTDYGANWTAKASNRNWKSIAMSSDGKIQTAVVYYDYIYLSHADSYIPDGKLGIGTTTPSSVLDVYATTSSAILTVKQAGSGSVVDFKNATGTVFTINNAGNTLLTGNLLPSTTTAYTLGSSTYLWSNLYTATSNLGIVASGTWQATPVAVGYGGTGGTSTSTARTNLGLAIGTDVQAYNASLAAIAASTWTGASSITTLGTITTGTWSGTAIAVAKGGTGSAFFTVAGPTVTRTYTFPDADATIVSLDGTQTLTNKTLTTPKFADLGYIADANGNAILFLDTVASAVNGIILANAAAAGNPSLTATGTDANISINLVPKGASGAVLIGGGTGKLTVGTIDPVFNIQGLKHATYMSGMTGVKEETTGIVQLTNGEYVIDFNELEQSSDLWVFYRITDFGQNWNKLAVLLSAEGPGGAWYQKDPQNNRLVIYSQSANSVSFRLSAPRFDWQKWLNLSDDGTVNGFAIDEIINDQYSQSTSTESQISDSSNEESGLLSEFVQKIKEALSSLGLFIENGIASVKEIITEKLTAKKARLDKIEMVDQNTGEIYCTWIRDGEWVKEKGECDNIISPESTPESPVPMIVPDETPVEESASSTEEIVPEETPPEEPASSTEEILPESQ